MIHVGTDTVYPKYNLSITGYLDADPSFQEVVDLSIVAYTPAVPDRPSEYPAWVEQFVKDVADMAIARAEVHNVNLTKVSESASILKQLND